MAVIRVLGEKVIVANTPPWTRKKHGMTIKSYGIPTPMIAGTPLGDQQYKLASAAHSLAGTKGKVRYKGVSMPRIAVLVAQRVGGSTGGKSRDERAKEAYDATSVRLAGGRGNYSSNRSYGGYAGVP